MATVLDLAAALLVSAVMQLALADTHAGHPSAVVRLAMVPATLAVAGRGRWPVGAAVAFIAGVAVNVALHPHASRWSGIFLGAYLLAYALGLRAEGWRARLALVGLLALFGLDLATDAEFVVGPGDVVVAAIAVGCFGGGRWARSRARLIAALQEREGDLHRQRAEIAGIAVDVERMRVDTDLDLAARDGVARIAALCATLAAAPDAADRAVVLDRVECLARATLEAMRGVLGVLRAERPDRREPPAPAAPPRSPVEPPPAGAPASPRAEPARRWPVIAAGLAALSLLDALLEPHAARPTQLLATLGPCVAIGLTSRRALEAALLAGASTVPAVVAGSGDQVAVMALFDLCLLAGLVGARLALRPAAAGLLAVTVPVGVGAIGAGGDWIPLVFGALSWALGRGVYDRGRIAQALAERADELERGREEFARLAVARERARIAHELHDVVSHHLTLIAVQARAARAASSDDPAVVAEFVGAMRDAARDALGEMDRLVDVLGLEPAGPEPDLATIVARARAAGLDLTADVDGVADSEVVRRIVQEGLTNILKHAPGVHAELRVTQAAGQITLTLVNDLAVAASADGLAGTGSGLGLAGLRSRIEACGGTLRCGPREHRWELAARIPLAASA